VAYRELIRAPWWLWAGAVATTGLLGLEVGVATDPLIGVGVFLASFAALGWGLRASTLVVEVTAGSLRAGPARAPLSAFGAARSHDPTTLRLRRGRDADPAAFLALRPWVHTAVEVAVTDAEDPTPYWLIATRRPEALLAVLAPH
jgi:hypothetical protein